MIRIDQKNSAASKNSASWGKSQKNEGTDFAKETASVSLWMKRIFIIVLLLALPLIGILQVLQTNQLAQNGLAANQLIKERNALEANIRTLEASIASNVKLREIRQQATTRLGMVPAEKTMRISINQRQAAPIQVPLRFTSESSDNPLPEKKWWESLLDFTFNFFSRNQESQQ
ncbi:MAG: hypothetical protein ACJ0KD_04775 [Dehalococcoidia bacterium]